jgi:hypothetical protein
MNNIFSHNCEHTDIYRLAVGVFNAYLHSLGGNSPRLRVSANHLGTDCHCTRSSHFHVGGALPRSLNDSFSSSRPPPISLSRNSASIPCAFAVRRDESFYHLTSFQFMIFES